VHLIISSQKHVTDQVNVKVVNSMIRGEAISQRMPPVTFQRLSSGRFQPRSFVNGVPWSTPWFMAANYGTMFIVYCGLFFISVGKRPGGAQNRGVLLRTPV